MPFAAKAAGNPPFAPGTSGAYKSQLANDPAYQFQLSEQNRRQDVFNRITRQQAQADQARLAQERARLDFEQQMARSNLLQELLAVQQQGPRTLMDLGTRLADTRFNIERQNLLDMLRLNDINQADAANRALRLLGR